MQPIQRLRHTLDDLASRDRYLFSASDLRGVVPELSDNAFRTLLSRAARSGVLERVCRGIYLVPRVDYAPGLVLYHAAARLRAGHLVYLSLESVLSQHGLISQIPINRITLMTGGRGGVLDCGARGTIEFTHTKRTVDGCWREFVYDAEKHLWVASPTLALRDLRRVGRNLDLLDEGSLEGVTK